MYTSMDVVALLGTEARAGLGCQRGPSFMVLYE